MNEKTTTFDPDVIESNVLNIDDFICSICTLLPNPDIAIEEENCSHIFCKKCIENWMKKSNKCPICNNITDMDVCYICSDSSRDNDTIFVVEKPKDIVLFEKMGNYKGKYHVLGGLISPLEGINPEDINLDSLVKRVTDNNVKEVIVVLKPSIEGETTMQYIKKILSKYDVRVSKIPIGIPMGTDIEYIDSMTLEMAFEDRLDVS